MWWERCGTTLIDFFFDVTLRPETGSVNPHRPTKALRLYAAEESVSRKQHATLVRGELQAGRPEWDETAERRRRPLSCSINAKWAQSTGGET